MPSPRKSTNPVTQRSPAATPASELVLLAAPQRAILRGKLGELVRSYRQAGRPIDPQTIEYAVALGIFASPADAAAIATRLLPDSSTEQARELAAAKDRIGRLAATLRAARAEVGKIVAALHKTDSGTAGEPPYLECQDANQVAALKPGRRHLDLTGALTGSGPGWAFTSPADDLAAELQWATETEDQLADMVSRLSELAARDERRELLQRRALLTGRLSPATNSAPKSSAA